MTAVGIVSRFSVGLLGVNLTMDYQAGREKQVQCMGKFGKDEGQCFSFPNMY